MLVRLGDWVSWVDVLNVCFEGFTVYTVGGEWKMAFMVQVGKESSSGQGMLA